MSKQFLRKRAVAQRYNATTRWVERAANDGRLPQPEYPVGAMPLWDLAALEENERTTIARGGRLGWRNKLLAELAAAPHDQAATIQHQYKDQIDALPADEREKLLARAQDIINETPETD